MHATGQGGTQKPQSIHFFQADRETSEKILFDTIDRINLARTGMIARPATDAGLVDVEVTCSGSHASPDHEPRRQRRRCVEKLLQALVEAEE